MLCGSIGKKSAWILWLWFWFETSRYFCNANITMNVDNTITWLTINLSDGSRAPPVVDKIRVFDSVYGFVECGKMFAVYKERDANGKFYVHFDTVKWNGATDPNVGVFDGGLELPELIRQIAERYCQIRS
jgi:hypothetical protein